MANLTLTGFQNWRVLCCRLFKKELFIRLKNQRDVPGRFSKALDAALRNLLSTKKKGFEPASF
jgi:hypothetical protein